MISTVLTIFLLALALGATGYSIIALYAIVRFRRIASQGLGDHAPPVSVLKPLCGVDRELEQNLESFCRQNYPAYEILFSVRSERDPAVPIVRRLEKRFPSVPIHLLVIGPPKYLNAKVHGLEEMAEAARHEILVISDSDVRVGPEYLRSVVAPLADPSVGLSTCLSRCVPGGTVWSMMEALGVNTQFMPGVLSSWLLMDMEFSLGPTMVTRKQNVGEIGGFEVMGDYLADDFVLGQSIAKSGSRVVLSRNIPEHLFRDESLRDSLSHRLRWERSSRCSRPAGFIGQIFTHSLPLALLAWAFAPAGNPVALAIVASCVASRALLAWQMGWSLLRDPALRKYWWILPAEDFLSFGIWCWAFIGNEIVWRGERFQVLKGGELSSVAEPARSIQIQNQRPEVQWQVSGEKAATHSNP